MTQDQNIPKCPNCFGVGKKTGPPLYNGITYMPNVYICPTCEGSGVKSYKNGTISTNTTTSTFKA